jgi:hypothetical protein
VFKFGHRYMSTDVRNRGYFSKLKGLREQNNLGNTDLVHSRE